MIYTHGNRNKYASANNHNKPAGLFFFLLGELIAPHVTLFYTICASDYGEALLLNSMVDFLFHFGLHSSSSIVLVVCFRSCSSSPPLSLTLFRNLFLSTVFFLSPNCIAWNFTGNWQHHIHTIIIIVKSQFCFYLHEWALKFHLILFHHSTFRGVRWIHFFVYARISQDLQWVSFINIFCFRRRQFVCFHFMTMSLIAPNNSQTSSRVVSPARSYHCV